MYVCKIYDYVVFYIQNAIEDIENILGTTIQNANEVEDNEE